MQSGKSSARKGREFVDITEIGMWIVLPLFSAVLSYIRVDATGLHPELTPFPGGSSSSSSRTRDETSTPAPHWGGGGSV